MSFCHFLNDIVRLSDLKISPKMSPDDKKLSPILTRSVNDSTRSIGAAKQL